MCGNNHINDQLYRAYQFNSVVCNQVISFILLLFKQGMQICWNRWYYVLYRNTKNY